MTAAISSHSTDVSDLDLSGLPATHRHGVRALRSFFDDIDGVSISRVVDGIDTTVFLDIDDGAGGLVSMYKIRRVLQGTGVEKVDLRVGHHTSIKLGYWKGVDVEE